MVQIVLLRHGKPDIPEHGKLRGNELHRWIELYNSAGIAPGFVPSQGAIEITSVCNTVVCSDLKRSIESASALGVKNINVIEPVFREMGLPFCNFPTLKLSPSIWAALFRILWFFGYSSNSESIHEARLRASIGANRLKEMAVNNGSVLLIGHGFTNRFIAKKLLSNGWKGPKNPGKKYWEFGKYEYVTL